MLYSFLELWWKSTFFYNIFFLLRQFLDTVTVECSCTITTVQRHLHLPRGTYHKPGQTTPSEQLILTIATTSTFSKTLFFQTIIDLIKKNSISLVSFIFFYIIYSFYTLNNAKGIQSEFLWNNKLLQSASFIFRFSFPRILTMVQKKISTTNFF